MCDNCECNRLCVPTATATVTAAVVTGTVAALTINQPLTGLNYFRLCIPCAIINGISNVDTVTFTDGTDTFIGHIFNNELLTISTLKKRFCRCCCDDVKPLVAYASQSQTTVTIINRIV